jgi:lysophospholipase L1-like esterase
MKTVCLGLVCAALLVLSGRPASGQSAGLELRKGDRIVFVGNTLAERLQQFNHFEALLMARFPDLELSVRNLGWSGDTITLQPRPLNFGDAPRHLAAQKADVILAFFGLNESFAGEAGAARFEEDLGRYLQAHLTQRYNGREPPRLVLISPLAHEHLPRLVHVDTEVRNRELGRYTEVMRRVAAQKHVPFVDLYTPSRQAMTRSTTPLTINGIHLTDAGDALVATLLMAALGFDRPGLHAAIAAQPQAFEALRETIRDKNQQFLFRFRPVNAEYVVGRRVEPFGAVNFPPEQRELDRIVRERDERIWKQAREIGKADRTRSAGGAAKPEAQR